MITSIDQVTVDWLTQTLQASGALQGDRVLAVEHHANDAFNSTIFHLQVQYTDATPADLPAQLLLKFNIDHSGEAEIPFYKIVMQQSHFPHHLVCCFAAEYDTESGASYLLLEDLSSTHQPPVTRQQILDLQGIPTDEQLDEMIDAIAEFHAYWWENPLLGKNFIVRPWYSDADHFRQHLERRQREWSAFTAAVADEIPAEVRGIYERTLAKLPLLWDAFLHTRVSPLSQITLSQGDCYLTQFLCSKLGVNDVTRIVDFQDVTANFPPYDLVYMFATFWTSEQRQENRRERRLLERYHQRLVKHGVRNYSLEQVWIDYRYMVLFMIFDAVWNQVSGSPKSYWWTKMQCLIAAYQDLDCASLIEIL